MKLILVFSELVILAGLVRGFSPLPALHRPATHLSMGFFDFTPVHGSGSGKEHLDEQWAAQQALLKARRTGNMDKAHMKQKYKDPSVNHLDLMMKEHEAKHAAMMKRMDSTYVQSEAKPKVEMKKKKFFWDK
jgi:hypothetical protein